MPRGVEPFDAAETAGERRRARSLRRRGIDDGADRLLGGFRRTGVAHSAAPRFAVLVEEFVELAAGSGLSEAIEAAFLCDLLRHPYETAPGRARERAADGNAPHAERGRVLH